MESAFESGVLFESEFITAIQALELAATRDFWRRDVVSASSQLAEWIRSKWATPDALLTAVALLLKFPEAHRAPPTSAHDKEAIAEEIRSQGMALQRLWSQQGEEVIALLRDRQFFLSRGPYREDALDLLAAEMEAYRAAGGDGQLPERFELLTSSYLEKSITPAKRKKGARPPTHPLFVAADSLWQLWSQYEKSWLCSAAAAIAAGIAQRKGEGGQLFFDDLLTKLDLALKREEGTLLAEKICRRYPIAMIDEFQDTDPLQYRIFDRIYAANREEGDLWLIGDPKQAIYSFRGADIFTYIQAKQEVDPDNGLFSLEENWRSHPALVRGVNALFSLGRSPFIYEPDICFSAVTAAQGVGAAALTIDDSQPPPLACWLLQRTPEEEAKSKEIAKTKIESPLAAAVAHEIATLLHLGDQGRGRIGDKRIEAKDLAVLVRDRFQAEKVQSALRRVGIASVFISRDSVFASDEASEMVSLLRAVANPSRQSLLSTALATRILGWSASALYRLLEEDTLREALLLRFDGYRQQWHRAGFMAMFYQLLRQERVSANLLSLEGGERRMTNLLHLAELAQRASLKRPGIENLISWLVEMRGAEDGECSDDEQLRLESDENLVQIVTIHKSKGLEYPIVFIPYIWSSKTAKKGAVIPYHRPQDHALTLDLGSEEQGVAHELAERERLAEDLRLLYVALTRAKYRCYFSWGSVTTAQSSALTWLLHQEEKGGGTPVCRTLKTMTDTEIRADLERLNRDEALLELMSLPEADLRYTPKQGEAAPPVPLIFDGETRQQWWTSSFSQMVRYAGEVSPGRAL
ncbi:MAG: UvrD-helicase domain-containing protein, partial [Gammaproteobacteria bacterium]|nr:UvrD-helicase domain-containing protein [Gammaproteobacteria bacterium]